MSAPTSPIYYEQLAPWTIETALPECAALFSTSYGKWSSAGPKPGRNVSMNAHFLKSTLLPSTDLSHNSAVLARTKERKVRTGQITVMDGTRRMPDAVSVPKSPRRDASTHRLCSLSDPDPCHHTSTEIRATSLSRIIYYLKCSDCICSCHVADRSCILHEIYACHLRWNCLDYAIGCAFRLSTSRNCIQFDTSMHGYNHEM